MYHSARFIILVPFFLFPVFSYSQNNDFEAEYRKFKKRSETRYNGFRDSVNAQYAEHMRKSWEAFKILPAIPVPPRPEPKNPPVCPPGSPQTSDPVPYEEVKPVDKHRPAPQPVEPVPYVRPTAPAYTFRFYNTPCQVPIDDRFRFSLASSGQNAVADAWELLSDKKYEPVLYSFLQLRDQMNLCDWAYIELIQTFARQWLGNSNETVIFTMFMLVQSGYNTRIAQQDEKLLLLFASNETIWQYLFVQIDGQKYYVLDRQLKEGALNVCNQPFINEQALSIAINRQPALDIAPSPKRIFTSKQYPGIKIELQTNRNLIDFYNSYPLNGRWDLYSKASLSSTIKETLYPFLTRHISGKSQAQAANMLINFVQTAFEYQTDGDQFGYERPLFGDETFFYPYSDCEDRSILFAVLVRELMGLKVVLLDYPGHLATAVVFTDPIAGDYMTMNGIRYLICDPTYIGASIGQTMPQFKSVKAKIIDIE